MNQSEVDELIRECRIMLWQVLSSCDFPFNAPSIPYDEDSEVVFSPYFVVADIFRSKTSIELRIVGLLTDVKMGSKMDLLQGIHSIFPDAKFRIEGEVINTILVRFDLDEESRMHTWNRTV